jgi:DNA-binding NtrC family response regulator
LAQVKLLRFLQEKEYRPLGSTQIRHADVRVITATNINVEKAVKEGRLRQDLYYRLNILPLVLPPLRERREDIPRLAQYFLAKYAAKFAKPLRGFSAAALQKLMLYDWPGNVRELEHVVERAAVLAEEVTLEGREIILPSAVEPSGQKSFQEMKKEMVEQFERTLIHSLLMATNGNISDAARLVQKDRRAFFQLMRKYGIDARCFKAGA